jgi:hypothetical protein
MGKENGLCEAGGQASAGFAWYPMTRLLSQQCIFAFARTRARATAAVVTKHSTTGTVC